MTSTTSENTDLLQYKMTSTASSTLPMAVSPVQSLTSLRRKEKLIACPQLPIAGAATALTATRKQITPTVQDERVSSGSTTNTEKSQVDSCTRLALTI